MGKDSVHHDNKTILNLYTNNEVTSEYLSKIQQN